MGRPKKVKDEEVDEVEEVAEVEEGIFGQPKAEEEFGKPAAEPFK